MIGHVDKALKRLHRIGGDVGSCVVDCTAVGTSVPDLCVDYVRRPLQRPHFARREFALVHVLAFLLVFACASILPHDALAMTTDIGDGLDVDGVSFRDAARIVYPYTYDANDADQVYEVLTDYLGFDWWALSSSVREKLKTDGNGDNPFALAARNNLQNMQYGSWKVGWLDIETHPITWLRITQLMGSYGMDALWLVDMTSEYKEQVTRYFLKWTLPRNEQEEAEINNKTITATLKPYYASMASPDRMPSKTSITMDNVQYCYVNPTYNSYQLMPEVTLSFVVNTLNVSSYDLKDYTPYVVMEAGGGTTATEDKGHIRVCLVRNNIIDDMTYDIVTRTTSSYGGVQYPYLTLSVRTINKGDVLVGESNFDSISNGTIAGLSILLSAISANNNYTLNNNTSASYYGGFSFSSFTDSYTPTPDPPTPGPVEPGDPTYDPPAADTPVTWPTIHLPDFNFPDISISIPTIQYDGTDYTQWLKQIDDDIRSYGHDIIYGISDFYDAFGDFSEDTSVLLADISRTLQAMGNEWTSHCDHITDEIYDGFYGLKQYIGSQCKYIVGTIKNETKSFKSEIVKWLKLIYNRLKGRSTTQPSIDDDEPGFWDWIGDILNGIINKLFDGLPDELKELIQDFEELTSYFPVSIPWDIAAVLGLFAHEPVTPAFPIDWVGSETYGIELHVVIDLSPWDEYAELFRQILFVAFVVGMIFYTMEQIDIFGIISSKVGK